MIIKSLSTLVAALSLAANVSAQLPHQDDLGKQVEHLALLATVPESQASSVAVASGNWSNPATWGGTLPTNFSTVAIPQGITVTVDTTLAARIRWIRVNGILNFATNVNTLLKVDTIVVDPVGSFVLGTAATPVSANVTAKVLFTDSGAIDRNWDPHGLSRGLICHGSARIFGSPTTSFAILSQPARKGQSSVTLVSAPTNWKVGDRLVLPSVGFVYDDVNFLLRDDDEELTITGVSGNVVSLNRPLKYNHLSPTGTATIPIPIAHLDRNVVFISENFAVPRRGHVMFMHNWDVQVSDALFEQCGRTDAAAITTDPKMDAQGRLIPSTTGNDRGRYSLHFHRTIPAANKPATVRRVSVVNGPKFGIVNHDSHVIVEDSVAYDIAGSAFFTEVGSEIGAFRRNLAIRSVRGVGSQESRLNDFGFDGNGFWFQGGGIEVTDNMAFKTRAAGFIFDTQPLFVGEDARFLRANLTPDNPYYDPHNTGSTLGIRQVPVNKFSGNITAGAAIGFTLRKNDPIGRASTLENSKAVNISSVGVDAEYGDMKTFRNIVARGGTLRADGSPHSFNSGTGDFGFISNSNVANITIEHSEFSNFQRGIKLVLSHVNKVSDTIVDNIGNIILENSVRTFNPTHLERITFRHTTAPIASNPELRAHYDVATYRPGGVIAPVSANGMALQWPQELGTNYYMVSSSVTDPNPVTLPVITTQPLNQTVAAGSTVTFSVVATGSPSFTYQWWTEGRTIPGANSATLTIPNVTTAQRGTYAVVVSNSLGSTNSQIVNLTVNSSTPLVLQSAVSRKTHGAAGTFDIALPLNGRGVECRRQGNQLTIVATFNQNVISGSASVTGTAAVSSTTFSGQTMTISLSGVADRQDLTISLKDIATSSGSVLAAASIPVAVLFADIDGSQAVNVVDIGRTRIRAATGTVDASSFPSDLNVDGAINVLDITLTRLNSGSAVR